MNSLKFEQFEYELLGNKNGNVNIRKLNYSFQRIYRHATLVSV